MKRLILFFVIFAFVLLPIQAAKSDTPVDGAASYPDQAGASGKFLKSTGVVGQEEWSTPTGTMGAQFDLVESGTNTTATMTCGTGCTINSSGSGTIAATTLTGSVSLETGVSGSLPFSNLQSFTTASVPDVTNYRYITDAQRTVLGNTTGTNTGDETQASIISALTYTPQEPITVTAPLVKTGNDIAIPASSPTVTGSMSAADKLTLNAINGTLKFYPESNGALRDGVTSDATAINNTIDAAAISGGTVVLADGIYAVSTPIILKSNVKLYIAPSATIKAIAGFSGDGIVIGEISKNTSGYTEWFSVLGDGTIDGANIVDYGILIYTGRFGRISVGTIKGANISGIALGTVSSASTSYEIDVYNTRIYYNDVANSASSIGVHHRRCSDSYVRNSYVIGYRTGFRADWGSVYYSQCHTWVRPVHGPQVYGFYGVGNGNSWSQCYADSPTGGGDGGITDVYGFYINAVHFSMSNNFVYNNGYVAEDNKTTGVYIAQAAKGSITNTTFTASSSSYKFKSYFSGYLAGTDIVGSKHDGYSYDTTDTNLLYSGLTVSGVVSAGTFSGSGANINSIDHGGLTGLADDDHTQYSLLAGRLSGQTIIGGLASGETLTLQSTAHATKGNIAFGTSVYDANNKLGIGTTTPSGAITLEGDSAPLMQILIIGHNNTSSARPNLFSQRSKGTAASPTVVVDGDKLLSIGAGGYDGSTYKYTTVIDMYAEGTPTTGSVPTNIRFSTGTATAEERMRIDSTGNVGIGTTDLDGTPAVGRLTAKASTNDGTTNGIVIRDSDEANIFNIDSNGQLHGGSVFQKCTVIKGATTADDYPLEKFPYAVTITGIHVYTIGGTNVVGGLDECTGTNGVCSSVTAVDADITGTAASDVADDGSLTNPGIAANNWIQWHTTSVSGTNTSVSVCFTYTVD